MRSRWSGGVRLLLLLSLAACSDSPLDFGKRAYPEARTPLTDLARDTEPEELPDVRYLAVYKTTPRRPEQVLAQIGPEGGSLRAGDFEIIVPAGAVARADGWTKHTPIGTTLLLPITVAGSTTTDSCTLLLVISKRPSPASRVPWRWP